MTVPFLRRLKQIQLSVFLSAKTTEFISTQRISTQFLCYILYNIVTHITLAEQIYSESNSYFVVDDNFVDLPR